MTIDQAIEKMIAMKDRYGGGVPLFFDCPHCNQSFTPGTLEAQAVHLKAVTDKPKK